MLMYFKPEANGRVTGLRVPDDGKPIEGHFSIDSKDMPAIPEVEEGFRPALYYTGEDLEWRIEEEPKAEDLTEGE